jgi:hypothetical protein
MNAVKILFIVGVGYVFIIEADQSNVISVHMEKKENSFLPQFSWRRRNGEVVELLDTMPLSERGVIQGGSNNMYRSLEKVRPELLREFGHDVAIERLRMNDNFAVIDSVTKGTELPANHGKGWWWRLTH